MHIAAFATAALNARAILDDTQPLLRARQTNTVSSTATSSTTSPQTSTPSTSTSQTSSSYLPLTTIFTPPATCSGNAFGRQDTSNAFRDFSAANRPCWPSGYTTQSFFSPGVCPSGYAIASQDVTQGVTSAWCCYPGFGLAQYGGNPSGSACSSFVNTPASVRVASGAQTLSNFVAREWPVQVMWARSDLADFDPPSAPVLPPTTSSTASPSTNITVTGTGTPDGSEASGDSGGLSTGAKAGIGVGVAVAVLAVLLASGFVLLRRKRRERSQFDSSTADVCYRYEKPQEDRHANTTNEMPDTNTALLQSKSGPHYEMRADQEPTELEGSEPMHSK